MSKELIAATVRELEDWSGVTMTQEPDGGKHSRIVLHKGDQSRLIIVAKTPSDVRALPNHLALVRRELRALGAEKARIVMGKPKAERPFKPHVPATQKPFETLEETMSENAPSDKIKRILNGIADLRYGEMLDFAEALSAAAIDTKLQRNRPHDWARMLQSLIDAA